MMDRVDIEALCEALDDRHDTLAHEGKPSYLMLIYREELEFLAGLIRQHRQDMINDGEWTEDFDG